MVFEMELSKDCDGSDPVEHKICNHIPLRADEPQNDLDSHVQDKVFFSLMKLPPPQFDLNLLRISK